MPGKNQDYHKGHDVGRQLHNWGEDFGPKELDAEAREILETLGWEGTPVTNTESFVDGVYNGYVLEDTLEEMRENDNDPPRGRRGRRR